MVGAVMRDFGRIDMLVNNAGATPHGNLLDLADAQWLDAYDAKIHAYVRVNPRLLAVFLKAAKGSRGEHWSAACWLIRPIPTR